jgi:tetratricopeptide (TPR) repeat protein
MTRHDEKGIAVLNIKGCASRTKSLCRLVIVIAIALSGAVACSASKGVAGLSYQTLKDCAQRKDHERSIRACTIVINRPGVNDKALLAAYRTRAYGWVKAKKYDKAIADYNKAISIDGTDVQSLLGRGMAREYNGEKSKAITDYRKALTFKAKEGTDSLLQRLAQRRLETMSASAGKKK